MPWWTVSPEWKGERAYLIAGGPSVAAQNLELLRDHRVIAINSSWVRAPFADIVFFGDGRWWEAESTCAKRLHRGLSPPAPQYGDSLLASGYAGRIVTCDSSARRFPDRLLRLRKLPPPGLSKDPTAVTMKRTSLTAAINLVVHLGVASIVILGLDGKAAADGSTHHYHRYVWDQNTGCWAEQRKDLVTLVKPLRDRGIEVVNASPGSAIDLWPIVQLGDYL